MRVISLHDRDQIEPVLRRNAYLHLYALGDLDEFYWPFTTWYGLEVSGCIQAVLLLYSGYETPTLMALAEPPREPLLELLRMGRPILPPRVYAHLSPGCSSALGRNVTVETREPRVKMALVDPKLDVSGKTQVQRLSAADIPELNGLYAVGYPSNWFDPRQIETGHYYGLRVNGELVAAAGPHVYSSRQRVAALGNIVTHPNHRGRGYAAAVTARLCDELRPTVDHIGLNVHSGNSAALACYRKLGFKPIAEYEEVLVVMNSPN